VHVIVKPLIVAVMLAAGAAAAAESKDSPKPSPPPAQKTTNEALKSPMVFYPAKGAADACGPGCSEWIAAEGEIDEGTAERLRTFLKRQSGPKRPIYFYSPGGLVAESLTMGRLMRERGLTAGVGRTTPQDCEPKQCAESKKAGRQLQAKFTSFGAYCASACVYALVGARTREVAAEAKLGIHAGKIKLKKIPKGVRIPPHFLADRQQEYSRRTTRYLVDMGIKPALLEAAQKIPHEDIKVLTRDEIVRFGIDTRSFVESAWIFDERAGVIKFLSESTPEGTESHTTTLRLACLARGQVLVGYSRTLNANEGQNPPLLKVSAGGKDFSLYPSKTPIAGGEVKILRDQRQQWVPLQFFELATAGDHMALAEGDKNPRVTKISTEGLAAALAALHCGYPSPPPGARAALTPRQQP
jgi:hypothetical protein